MIKNLFATLLLLSFSLWAKSEDLAYFERVWDDKILSEASSYLQDQLNSSFDDYLESRENFRKILKSKYPKRYSFWLRKLDHQFKGEYFERVADIIEKSSHPLSTRIARQIKLLSKSKSYNSIQWMDNLMYRRHGRGAYDASKGQVYLGLTSIAENIVPMVHEVVHSLDETLLEARLRLKEAYQRDHNYYLFLKNVYLLYYKEVLPRLVACEVYIDLRDKNLLVNKSPREESEFNDIVAGNNTCEQWTKNSFGDFARPNYFWDEGSEDYKKIIEYEKQWLNSHGLEYPFFEYRDSSPIELKHH